MKNLTDYHMAIEKTPDYQAWCKHHGYISDKEYVARGLTWAIAQYDYDIIANDAIEEFGNNFNDVMNGLKKWLKNSHGNASCDMIRIIESVKKQLS